MREHGLRQQAVGEMHLRRWPVLPVPCVIVQWVLLIGESERAEELRLIEKRAVPARAGVASHREGVLGERTLFTWESHSEGSSITLFHPSADSETFLRPLTSPELADAIAWVEQLPGEVIRSTRIWLTDSEASAEEVVIAIDLHTDEMVSCRIGGGIRIWSDFRLHDDGFGRLIVAANGADPRDVTRQIQRLQELGNYRNRALLGLPVAQETWPKLVAAETRLNEISSRVADEYERDDDLLDALSELSLELAAVANAIDFRMDATKAYAQLVEERLHQLEGEPIAGFQSLADFTQRRFRPAISTCGATGNRVQRLALRAEQLSSLLRARIETRIENQNAQMLHSMERSVSMQVRLQQLVEGLSIVALSYYILGLAAYLLKGVPDELLRVDRDKLIAALVIPVMILIWLLTRAVKKRLLANPD